MAYRRDDGAGCLVLLALIACGVAYNWARENPTTAGLIAVAVVAAAIIALVSHARRKEEV
jgi:hypothetical protein